MELPEDPIAPEQLTPWLPDEQLVPSILAGCPKTISDLTELDRCWVVAGLSARGMVAEDIADRLKCSLRLIRSIRADPYTKGFRYAAVETSAFANEVALRDSAIAGLKASLAQAERERDRYKAQRDNMIDAQIVGIECCRRCGTPWDRGNTYFYRGKRNCRTCARRRQKELRDARRDVDTVTINAIPDPIQALNPDHAHLITPGFVVTDREINGQYVDVAGIIQKANLDAFVRSEVLPPEHGALRKLSDPPG
jgi:hypothetical protein